MGCFTIRLAFVAAIIAAMPLSTAAANDSMKIAIGQRGGWEQSVSELG